jgi:hypothetical protein
MELACATLGGMGTGPAPIISKGSVGRMWASDSTQGGADGENDIGETSLKPTPIVRGGGMAAAFAAGGCWLVGG